ncbi:MAG: glutamate racemase [Coleofasciculaceae cyanobacterium SM2_1_6]|nr:glutamate racemase [Coleofasciculaceae cyanobacterium SM2_1_6]
MRKLEKPQRIGIFDSGVGGITVLREVYRHLPNESVVYFGDTARLPYGNRSRAEITEFMREIITWFETQEVKMVITACNTSDALALETIRQEFSLPILGLILPGARAAVKQGKRIGVIATPATAQSNAYRRAIQEVDPTCQVWQVGCPEFVPLIEQNRANDPYTREVAEQYLRPLLQQQIDTLVYGCTHYPHLDRVLRSLLPSHIKLVDPALHVATAAAQELELLGRTSTKPPTATRFCVSGSPSQFAQVAKQWLGCTPRVEKIYLRGANSLLPLDSRE